MAEAALVGEVLQVAGSSDSVAVPSWLKSYLSQEQAADIGTAIERLEYQTDAEIVPMIVRESKRAEYSWFAYVLFSFAVFGVIACFLPGSTFTRLAFFDPLVGTICTSNTLVGCHLYFGLVTVFVVLLIAFVLHRFRLLRRVSVLLEDVEQSVFSRAMVEFYHYRLDETRQRTAVLFFVSIRERRAVILADKGISAHLPAGTWVSIVDMFTSGLRRKNFGDRILGAIEHIGSTVANVAPKTAHNVNEIKDALVFPKDR